MYLLFNPVYASTTIEVPTERPQITIEEKIRQAFPEDPDTAYAIAQAESSLLADAVNPEKHRGCIGSYGLFQIACVHNTQDPEQLKDVDFNIKKAREIYDQYGWKPWGAYSDKRYLEFLP